MSIQAVITLFDTQLVLLKQLVSPVCTSCSYHDDQLNILLLTNNIELSGDGVTLGKCEKVSSIKDFQIFIDVLEANCIDHHIDLFEEDGRMIKRWTY